MESGTVDSLSDTFSSVNINASRGDTPSSAPAIVKKTTLTPAEQILAGTMRQQSTGPYIYPDGSEPIQMANPYSLMNTTDVGTLSRSMTALGLSNTIPEEPSGVDLNSAPLMNARRIASKSAIDLVGLNEDDVFDANASLNRPEFSMNFAMPDPQHTQTPSHSTPPVSTTDHLSQFQLTSLPTRSVIFTNLSPQLTDANMQTLIQMSGDAQSIRTEFRLQGMVQVTYFDIRAAAAAQQLNGMPVADQSLNVQFVTTPGAVGSFTEGTILVHNIDPGLDVQKIAAHFSVHGDVKGVHIVPEMDNHRLIEFYDIRHANAATEALNMTDSTKLRTSTGLTPTAGMKHTMSLQQLTGMLSDHEQLQLWCEIQEEGNSVRSWDGTKQSGQNMDFLMSSTDVATPTHPTAVAAPIGGMMKSMSFGSGLSELKVASENSAETPTRKSRAVKLTPELAKRLRIPDTTSGLGGMLFQGTGAGLKMPGRMSYGNSGLMEGFDRSGMTNSASVETGLDRLDRFGQQQQQQQPSFTPSLQQDPLLPQFSSQPQLSPTFQQRMGLGGGLNLGSSYNPTQQSLDLASFLGQAGSGNFVQTLAAAQSAGVNIYDILARLPPSSLGALTHLLGPSRMGMGDQQQPSLGMGHDPMAVSMNQHTAGRFTAGHPTAPSSSQIQPNGISSPSFSTTATGGGNSDPRNMSKSASLPALHVAAEDHETTVRRFGGRLSRRNVDPVIEAERRAQQQRLYALDLDKIRRKDDKRTTLMIKNIPNKYTQKMLLTSMDETLKGTYDFFYLPIDFKNKCNVGYGFINMRDPEDIILLVERFHNKKWERFNSEKICCVAYGRIQGKQALINHFQNSSLMHEDKKHRPVLFVTDGPGKGEPEQFPVGSNIRPKITLKDRDFRSRERSGHWS